MENRFDCMEASGEDGVWSAVTAIPRADISHLVMRYHGFSAPAWMGFADTMSADLFYPVIINFGDDWRIGSDNEPERFDSFIAGLADHSTFVGSNGISNCLQVDLTPFGARALLQRPLHELNRQVVALDDVFGSTDNLRDRLMTLSKWRDRIALVDDILRQRAEGFVADPLARAAWQTLSLANGQIRIAALAREMDCSREHLSRRFRESIGLSPKAAARIMRFRNALTIAPALDYDWAAVALDGGYTDQAHFINEFSKMSGSTPTRYTSNAA